MIKFLTNFFKKRISKEVLYVDNNSKLSELKKKLDGVSMISLDTEFDWRTTYFPKISLVQISFNKNVFLIDCLKIKNFDFLKRPLESKNCRILIHSSRSDSIIISNCLKIFMNNVFDVQVAEKILSGKIENYANIVEKYTKVKLDKNETNSNWLKRPLSSNQEKYAAEDVEYLEEIFTEQKKLLKKRNLYNSAKKMSFNEVSLGNKPLKHSRIEKKAGKLSEMGKRIFLWREELAEEVNVPPNYVLKDSEIKKMTELLSFRGKKIRKKCLKLLGNSDYVDNFLSKFS